MKMVSYIRLYRRYGVHLAGMVYIVVRPVKEIPAQYSSGLVCSREADLSSVVLATVTQMLR